jgi:hypothetical protein
MKTPFGRKQISFVSTTLDLPILAVFLSVAVYLFNATLFRWGDLLIDTFRDFYLPSAILNGKVLYRDIYYEYGFFAPYFIAGWFKLFGASILSLALCGLFTLVATVMAVYKISSLFISKLLSCFVGIIFILVFAFGNYINAAIFNFILPYTFASIFFTLFFAWAVFFFLKSIISENTGYALAWACFLTIAFTARIELSLLVWGSFFLSFVMCRKVEKKLFFAAKIIFIPIIAALFCYFIFFIFTRSFSQFMLYFFGLMAKTKDVSFTRTAAGLNDIRGNLASIGTSLLWHAALLFSAGAGAFFSGLVLAKMKYRLRFGLAFLFILFFSAVTIYFSKRYFNFFLQYKALPVMLLAGIVFLLTTIRSGTDRRERLALIALFLISLVILSRVFLRVTPNFYNFFLIVPGIAAYYLLVYRVTADLMERHLYYFFNPAYILILSIVFAFQALLLWHVSHTNYQAKNFVMSTNKGTLISHSDTRALNCWLTVDYLSHNTRPADTLLVVPEGIGFNFFADRKNPTPYMYLQPDSLEVFGDSRIISDLARFKVDYIVLTARDTGDHGPCYFGIDYAHKLYAWILDNYTLVQQFGPYPFTSPEFGIAIFKRK